MYKFGIMGALLALAGNANASGFVLPANFTIPTTQDFAAQSRQSACDAFNARVELINKYIVDNDLAGDNIQVSKNLCRYISMSEGQIENSGLEYRYINDVPIGLPLGRLTISETIDITREFELVMLSQAGTTRYLFYVDGDVVLRNQSFTALFGPLRNVSGSSLSAALNSDKVLENVFHDSSIQVGAYEATDSATVCGRQDFLSPFGIILVDDSFPECIPGGKDNSSFWVLDDFFPQTSNTNTSLTIENSTTVGFSVGGSAGIDSSGPAAGLDVSFSAEKSTSTSKEVTVMGVSTVKSPNDVGIKAELTLSAEAITAIEPFDNIDLSATDNILGSSAWRDLDISASATYREIVNTKNCKPKTTRKVGFYHLATVRRGAFDFDGDGSKARYDEEDSEFRTRSVLDNMVINTECIAGANNKLYRVFKPGILN
ncbi:hypothetical protein SG34_029695 [Thalassomonas viridans]|uniref:Uncharacterized protein n=1 Tax=Thalassomonas viridans TaxID=137584 RepID=A0AAE9Z9C0_9GAMM|nr:hypothetical protein [Thalassomonas viridans]WDE08913.1 hypothetical protein SG34_034060 [Thalassomonas viridans]WDE08960.1 hypothetical protein SG34_029695 [Thalassomonas viridans]